MTVQVRRAQVEQGFSTNVRATFESPNMLISFPFPLRYLYVAHPQAMGKVLGIVYRAISTHLIHKAGFSIKDGATGAVSLRGPADPALW